MLVEIRQMHFREKVPRREIARRTSRSRNTVRVWLRQTETTEPKHTSPSIVDGWADELSGRLKTDSHSCPHGASQRITTCNPPIVRENSTALLNWRPPA